MVIRDSTDPKAIREMLNSVRGIDRGTARGLLNETKDTIAVVIRDSTDPKAINWLLSSVDLIDEESAKWLEKKQIFNQKESLNDTMK